MSEPLIRVEDLKIYFKQKSSKPLSFRSDVLKAVDGVSFVIERGKTFGLVGESGSGKSTIGKAILRYHKPTGGKIYYGDAEIGSMKKKELLPFEKKMQSVFQDPYASLDPSHTVQDIICEPMQIHKMYTPAEQKVAKYFLQNLSSVFDDPIASLAEKSGVRKRWFVTSVVRSA